jgi:P4 family phage/plasmid primase-like protien
MKLDRAKLLIDQGYAVFPCVPNGKKPITMHGFKDAARSHFRAGQWWTQTPEANIGIATGEASGQIAVIDVDIKNGAKGRESLATLKGIAPTLTASTPSGGWHLYYRAPGPLPSRNGLLPGVDLKSDGGYVIGPGSDIDGVPYEFLDPSVPIAPLPAAVLELMTTQTSKRRAQPLDPEESISEGLRNEKLASIAGVMRRKGLGSDEIAATLHAVNAKRCQPPLLEREVEQIAESIAKYPVPVGFGNGDGHGNGNINGNGHHAPVDDEVDDRPPGFTDDALALAFTDKHTLDWRYVAAWGDWLHWDGKRWLKEATLRAFYLSRLVCRQAAARCEKPKIAAKVASAATVAAVERLAKADRRHAATVDQWDQDPWLLNTPGGVVDLKTGQMRTHERSDYITKVTTASAANFGRPNQWMDFLDAVTNGDKELQGYLGRVAGYALTGNTGEHALFFFYGTGANGKSVFLNTLASVLGDYAVNAPMDTFMETRTDRHPTDLAALRGARLVTSIEVENGRRWAESKIKSLTGGDKISARFMRQDFFEYRPQFKLLVAGNHKPGLRDIDEAMHRRLHLVPFTVTIPPEKRDKNLSEKLLAEKDFILQWAIAGCVEWQERGLEPPPCVVSATEEYFEAEDVLGQWIEECCVMNSMVSAKTSELFAAWKEWADKFEGHSGSMKRFSVNLAQRGFEKKKDWHGVMVFSGIGLKNQGDSNVREIVR